MMSQFGFGYTIRWEERSPLGKLVDTNDLKFVLERYAGSKVPGLQYVISDAGGISRYNCWSKT